MKASLEERPNVTGEKNATPLSVAVVFWKRTDGLLGF